MFSLYHKFTDIASDFNDISDFVTDISVFYYSFVLYYCLLAFAGQADIRVDCSVIMKMTKPKRKLYVLHQRAFSLFTADQWLTLT